MADQIYRKNYLRLNLVKVNLKINYYENKRKTSESEIEMKLCLDKY